MKVLVVDDDELNVDILREILEDDGFEVVTAENGQDALDKLRADTDGEIQLILLDRMMPVMTGTECMQELRKHDQWKNIPVIFQTAASQPKDLIDGMATGAYYYLTKPFDKNIVLSVIRSAFDATAKKKKA